MATWIDCEYGTEIGTIGYLVETTNNNTGHTTWSLRERPLRTNQSNEARLSGWCGETDNRSRFAHGVARVAKVSATTMRAQVKKLDGADLAAHLYRDGHPDLIPMDLRGSLVVVGLKGGDASDAKAAVCVDLDRGLVTNGEEWAALVRVDRIDELLEQTEAEIVSGPTAWDGRTFGDGNGGTVERRKDGTVHGNGLYAPGLSAA